MRFQYSRILGVSFHHAVTPLRSYAVSFAVGAVSFLMDIYIILLYIIYYI
jgi:hypothetical protein